MNYRYDKVWVLCCMDTNDIEYRTNCVFPMVFTAEACFRVVCTLDETAAT